MKEKEYLNKIKEVAEEGSKNPLTWLAALKAIIALVNEYNEINK